MYVIEFWVSSGISCGTAMYHHFFSTQFSLIYRYMYMLSEYRYNCSFQVPLFTSGPILLSSTIMSSPYNVFLPPDCLSRPKEHLLGDGDVMGKVVEIGDSRSLVIRTDRETNERDIHQRDKE